jgi:hypothetical protein
MPVRIEKQGPVTTVILDRPAVRNAVDARTAAALRSAFDEFDQSVSWRLSGSDSPKVIPSKPSTTETSGQEPRRNRRPIGVNVIGHGGKSGYIVGSRCDWSDSTS